MVTEFSGWSVLVMTSACAPLPEEPVAAGPVGLTPVRIGHARQFEAPSLVSVSGSVVSPESPSNVAFLVSGTVIQTGPREGVFVRRGQTAAVIDPADYALGVEAAAGQAHAARALLQKSESPARPEVLEQARVAFERAQDEYRRMKQLYEL